MKKCKRFLALTIICAIVLMLTACSGSSTPAPATTEPTSEGSTTASAKPDVPAPVISAETEEELYEAAKKEGKVTIYSMSSRIPDVKKTFEEKYPGVEVDAYNMKIVEVFEKVQREHEAGITNADVIFVKDSDGTMLNEFLKNDIVYTYVPKDIGEKIDKPFTDPLFCTYIEVKAPFYNTDSYSEPPIDSWWDYTRPEWKGKIMCGNPLVSLEMMGLFNAMTLHADEMAAAYKREFGEDIVLDGTENAGYEWIKRFLANDIIFGNSDGDVAASVGAAGQKDAPLGIITSSKVRENKKGLKLAMIYNLDPIFSVANPAVLAIIKNNPHPAGAKLLIRYMAGGTDGTDAGYTPFDVEGSWPTRSDMVGKDPNVFSSLVTWKEDYQYNYRNVVKVTEFFTKYSNK